MSPAYRQLLAEYRRMLEEAKLQMDSAEYLEADTALDTLHGHAVENEKDDATGVYYVGTAGQWVGQETGGESLTGDLARGEFYRQSDADEGMPEESNSIVGPWPLK